MRIVVEGVEGEGVTTMARMVHKLLSSAYIPVDDKFHSQRMPDLSVRVRKVAERLESPVEIATEIAPRPKPNPISGWDDYLFMDPEDGPSVKGTLVTVDRVVSLIRDGWSWKDILRTHPELTEDDIRACLSYTVHQQDGLDAIFVGAEED